MRDGYNRVYGKNGKIQYKDADDNSEEGDVGIRGLRYLMSICQTENKCYGGFRGDLPEW